MMKKMNKRAYESPEAEVFKFMLEQDFLDASITGREKDPVGGADEGETDGWGWN